MSLQGQEGGNVSPTCITTPARESSQSTNSKLPAVCCLLSPSHRLWGSVPRRQWCRAQTSSQKNLPFGPQVVAASPKSPPTAGKPAAHAPGAGQGLQGWAVPASPSCLVYAPSLPIQVLWDFPDLYYSSRALSSSPAPSLRVLTASLPKYPLARRIPAPVCFRAPDPTHLQDNTAAFIRRHLASCELCLVQRLTPDSRCACVVMILCVCAGVCGCALTPLHRLLATCTSGSEDLLDDTICLALKCLSSQRSLF